jgi:purine-nucleoside phosphorylase
MRRRAPARGSRISARPRLLLLAAFPPELAGLDRRPPRGVACATTGAGAVVAAAATARLLAARRPARVIFVGTCGAYRATLPPGAIVSAREAIAVSAEELEGKAYRPAIERTRWRTTLPLPFPPAIVAVPPAITRSSRAARSLGRMADVEHLELTGVLEACRAAGVPCGAALAVSNRVGPRAHAEWKAHHARVSADLVAALAAAGGLGGAPRARRAR